MEKCKRLSNIAALEEENAKLKEENTRLQKSSAYYKGFYEGIKELTTLLGEGPIEINHNFNINGVEEETEEQEDNKTSNEKVLIGKIEGKDAEKLINLMKELGVK